MKTIIKPKLEEQRAHAFDKKVMEREAAKGAPDPSVFYSNDTAPIEQIDIMQMREDMKNRGEDITKSDIQREAKLIFIHDHYINIYIYQCADRAENRAAVLFLHGGGFIGGEAGARENQCRYLAEQSGALIISCDYRLAPEQMFPAAVEDACGTLDWMIQKAQALGIDADKIVVAGDSAGANLAANCVFHDSENRIRLAVYIYGALDLTSAQDTFYKWDYTLYKMEEEQKEYIMRRLYRFKHMSELIQKLYVPKGHPMDDPMISPIYADTFQGHPDTLMIEAEFDYFRICNDAYADKLEKAGSSVEVLFYEGMDHAFFDRIGMLEQAADCIREIAKRIIKL